MWIIHKGRTIFICSADGCDNTDHFVIESRGVDVYFICFICDAEYDINAVVEWQ